MTEVSIILPTYNRADVLPRAIASVLAQSFQDWELIVIDDGSTDNTAEVVVGIDPRVRLLRKENGGCYVARNHGLRASTGKFITFLDSDDEWLPHFLELTTSFLKAFPEEHYVMTEFWADWGSGTLTRENRTTFGRIWRRARDIGSTALDLRDGVTDENLRVYDSCEPIGAWGRDIAAHAGFPDSLVYQGKISRHYRWECLGWVPSTMLTRQALETVGLYPEDFRIGADHRFFVRLSDLFRTNMIAVPTGIKHDAAPDNRPLSEGHLASGQNEYRYAKNRLALFNEMFMAPGGADPETERIFGLYHLYAGRTALELSMRNESLMHLRTASRLLPDQASPRRLRTLVFLVPSGRLSGFLYRSAMRTKEIAKLVISGKMSAGELFGKVWKRLGGGVSG
ncbi:MAG: glycosyltransferase family 2 protein [Betaproteobacteria bacterium]